MLSLSDRLRERIEREGALSFYDWMKMALYDPDQGYYCAPQRQKWGRSGDYRTSPERSALFAATFARYFASLYENLGSPSSWSLIEAGAGNGHFAAGVLETLRRRFPEAYAATTYVIDELSQDSQARANELLDTFKQKVIFRELSRLDGVSHGVIFSNELLDALPVHRVTLQAGEFREYFVNVARNGDFEWTLVELSNREIADLITKAGIQLVEGQIVEISPDIESWLRLVAAKLKDGYVITVDYGDEAPELRDPSIRPKGSLRAFRDHEIVDDLLARPGEQDITSSVDWTFVKNIGTQLNMEVVDHLRQDRFLLREGLLKELELGINEAAIEAEKSQLSTSAREMILPEGMAASFQVLVQRKRHS